MRKVLLLSLLVIVLFGVKLPLQAQNVIASFTNATTGDLDVVSAGITASPLTRVGDLGVGSCGRGFSVTRFPSNTGGTAPYDLNKAVQLVLTPVDTNNFIIDSISFDLRRSGSGSTSLRLAYRVGNSGSWVEPTTVYTLTELTCSAATYPTSTARGLNIVVPRGSNLTIRLCAYAARGATGNTDFRNIRVFGTVNGSGTNPGDTTGNGGGGGGGGGGPFRPQYEVFMPEYNQDSIGFDTARFRANARLLDTARLVSKGFIYKIGLVSELRFETINTRIITDSSTADLNSFNRVARNLTSGVEYSVVAFVRYRFNGNLLTAYSPVRSVFTKENRIIYFFRGGLLPLTSNITLQPIFQGVTGSDTLVVQNIGIDTLTVANLRTANGTIAMLPNPLRLNPFSTGQILINYTNESTGTYSNTFQFFSEYLNDDGREITASYTVNSAPATFTFATLPGAGLSESTARLSALLQNNSTQQLIERGFVYNMNSDQAEPSLTDPQSTIIRMPQPIVADYDSVVDNLEQGIYKYKAYIITNFGTYYGTQQSFATIPISAKANISETLAVWPVPAKNELNIGTAATVGGKVKIYNNTGKLISEAIIAENQTTIRLSETMKSGQYLLLLNLNNGKVLKANFLKQ